MTDYGRMQIMSMPDEEIERILKEEGKELPPDTLELFFEEMQRRKELDDNPGADLGLSEEELEEINAQSDEEDPEEEEQSGEEPEEEPEEASEERKIEELEKEIDRQNRENKKILITACVVSAVVAVGAVAVLLILHAIGKL